MNSKMSLSNQSKLSLNINLQQIYADEEEDNVVYSIREEILENVLTEIDKISLERRVYRFVSECAINAMKKLISIHFYYRASVPDFRYHPWKPDEPIAPSQPDTWATKRVPVQPRSKTAMEKEEPESTKGSIVCTCNLGVKCLCYLDAEGRIRDELEILFATKSKSRPSTVDYEKTPSEEVEEEEEEEAPEIEAEDTLDVVESEKCVLREGFSKIGFIAHTLKLPKIELPPPMVRGSKIEILELPPIRVDANFQSRPVEPPKKKMAKKKKKKK